MGVIDAEHGGRGLRTLSLQPEDCETGEGDCCNATGDSPCDGTHVRRCGRRGRGRSNASGDIY